MAAGTRVAFADADVGQKDVGPLATITPAYLNSTPVLRRAQPVSYYFVDAVSPVS